MKEEWLLPTPTAREGKGSHGKLHPAAPGRKDSIRNLDLSGIVKLLAAKDLRVMGDDPGEELPDGKIITGEEQ